VVDLRQTCILRAVAVALFALDLSILILFEVGEGVRLALFLFLLLPLLLFGTSIIRQRRVSPRTRALKAALEELEVGRWPDAVEIPVNDEIGELTATFNAVASARRKSEEELQRAHEELEERVIQRTEDLARTNRALEEEVAERRRAESALRKSEQYFRQIFEEGPLGMGVIDEGGSFVKVNATLARMLLTTPEEMVGRALADYRPEVDSDETNRSVEELFREGRTFQEQVRALRTDGELRRFDVTATAIHEEHRKVAYGLLMVEDVTERLRAEERLVESERYVATGRMAARIAHEINNPLAGIKNAFRLVKGSIPTDHPHHRYVGRIDREVDRLAGIVRQMYGIYQPEVSGPRRIRVSEVIDDVVSLITAGEPGGETPVIRLEIEEECIAVTLHQLDGMLRQVLHNLLQNATEASPRGQEVVLRVRTEGESLVIEVADQGSGIAEENRGRIFEPFFTTKEGRGDCGLGLGLAISLRAAEAMGGTLLLEREAGSGTTFRLTVPLKVELPEGRKKGATTPLPSR
jgi:PAS domain S-box-containing protein